MIMRSIIWFCVFSYLKRNLKPFATSFGAMIFHRWSIVSLHNYISFVAVNNIFFYIFTILPALFYYPHNYTCYVSQCFSLTKLLSLYSVNFKFSKHYFLIMCPRNISYIFPLLIRNFVLVFIILKTYSLLISSVYNILIILLKKNASLTSILIFLADEDVHLV